MLAKRRLVYYATLTAALLASASASAGEDDWTPTSQGNRVALDFNMLSTKHYLSLAWTPWAQISVTKEIAIDAELPFTYGSYSFDLGLFGSVSRNAFIGGNPTVGAHYTLNLDRDIALHGGLAIAVPTNFSPSADAVLTGGLAAEATAFYDGNRFAIGYVPIIIRLGGEIQIIPKVFYRGTLNPAFWIPVASTAVGSVGPATISVDRDFAFFLEQGNEGFYRASFGLVGGLRFQQVFMFGKGINDNVQTALEPFVGYDPEKGHFFARMGFLVALDNQLGFGFDTDKIATLRLQAGGKF
jgi:hypothetical protein